MEFLGKTTGADAFIFSRGSPDPGSNLVLLCLLNWLESSLPFDQQGKPMQYLILVLRREY